MGQEMKRLDERKSAILRAVVTEYIQTAQPVGSGHVSESPLVSVSPATVRNEMASLESEGYLVQPHTSAGRIPTDKGYRFFVDHLSGSRSLGLAQRQQVRDFFAQAHGELEQMLDDTSKLLSRLTDYAAVVVGPAHEGCVIRSAQLVALGSRLVLLVVVLSNGVVEKHSIETDEDLSDERVAAASAVLARHLSGHALAEVPAAPRTGDRATDVLASLAVDVLRQQQSRRDADQVFVGGASRMADAFDAVETVRSVLGILEQQYVVVSLLRDVLDRGLTVAIGTEHGVEPLAECSVVVAPYKAEGEDAGTIGLLGPTRMDYPQALAAVAVVSQRLGSRLSEGQGPVGRG
jgi:heat-inducible transcriptional repressor